MTDELKLIVDKKFTDQFWASTQGMNNIRNEQITKIVDQATSKAREEGYKEGFKFGQSQRTEYETNAENAWLRANPPCYGGKPWRK